MPDIVIDTPRWFYSSRNSDWRMKLSLAKALGKRYSVVVSQGWLYDLVYNLQYVVPKILPFACLKRGFAGTCVTVRAWLATNKARIFITQGTDPPIPSGLKTIWETYFIPPRSQGGKRDFVRGGRSLWIQQLEKYGPCVDRIAVRGQYSANLLKRMYPEYEKKVVDLSFLHDEYPVASLSEVEKKQRRCKCVEFLFVGRDARRKGLQELLGAFQILVKKGCSGFRLTIISDFHDGVIDVPAEKWVRRFEKMDHQSVLKLMRESHVFVMPSRFESYGLVYLEAMASGCVVCVPKAEPQCEFVDYGRAGVVLDGELSEMAEQFKTLIDSDEVRLELSLAGLKRYKEVYSQAQGSRSWDEVIESLLA